MRWFVPLALLALGGCNALPKDFDGTSDRIAQEHRFRVGLIAEDGVSRCPDGAAAYIARVGDAAKAMPQVTRGASEALLEALRQGDLDLVIGELAPDSPWKTDVSIIDPLIPHCPGDVSLSAVARNGENRWIMLLEDAGRAFRGQGGGK